MTVGTFTLRRVTTTLAGGVQEVLRRYFACWFSVARVLVGANIAIVAGALCALALPLGIVTVATVVVTPERGIAMVGAYLSAIPIAIVAFIPTATVLSLIAPAACLPIIILAAIVPIVRLRKMLIGAAVAIAQTFVVAVILDVTMTLVAHGLATGGHWGAPSGSDAEVARHSLPWAVMLGAMTAVFCARDPFAVRPSALAGWLWELATPSNRPGANVFRERAEHMSGCFTGLLGLIVPVVTPVFFGWLLLETRASSEILQAATSWLGTTGVAFWALYAMTLIGGAAVSLLAPSATKWERALQSIQPLRRRFFLLELFFEGIETAIAIGARHAGSLEKDPAC